MEDGLDTEITSEWFVNWELTFEIYYIKLKQLKFTNIVMLHLYF